MSAEFPSLLQYALGQAQLFLELGIFLAQTVSKQALQALVFFFERDKIAKIVAV